MQCHAPQLFEIHKVYIALPSWTWQRAERSKKTKKSI